MAWIRWIPACTRFSIGKEIDLAGLEGPGQICIILTAARYVFTVCIVDSAQLTLMRSNTATSFHARPVHTTKVCCYDNRVYTQPVHHMIYSTVFEIIL